MKIAVACSEGMVSGHFGHCEEFQVFETDGSKIVQTEQFSNASGRGCAVAEDLGQQGVNVVLAGGMGAGAVNRLSQYGIQAVIGVTGDAREAVRNYLDGKLQSSGSLCAGHHGEHGENGEHHCHCHGHHAE